YRLGNTIFQPAAPARLAAVLDWEMATIGDPLADLGYMCMMWSEKDDPEGGLRHALGSITRREGFATRAGLIVAYEQGTGPPRRARCSSPSRRGACRRPSSRCASPSCSASPPPKA